MIRVAVLAVVAFVVALGDAAAQGPADFCRRHPEHARCVTPTVIPTDTPAATPTDTPTVEPTSTVVPTDTPVPTPTSFLPSSTATATATETPPSPSPSPSPTVTQTPTNTFYVSLGGNDANDGRSPATAWRTFARVTNDQVPAGATILAEAGGVWTEQIVLGEANLRFGVYGTGARPTIVAPNGLYALYSNNRAGTWVEGYEFTSETRIVGQYGIVRIGTWGAVPGEYVFRNNVVHGADGYLLTTRGYTGLVEGNEFYDHDGSGPQSAISLGGYEGSGRAVGTGVVFRNNHVHDTDYRGVGTWGSGILVEHNLIERWSAEGVVGSTTQAPAGIYVASRFAGDVIVRGNTLNGSGVEHRALWVDFGPHDRVYFEDNVATNARNCFFAEATDNVVFRGNRCEQIVIRGVTWGGGGENFSHNGLCELNTFVGPEPTNGWIVVNAGSDAVVQNNTFVP